MSSILKAKIPLVFISYTHDSPDHKIWVAKLASKLRENGIDVILDQWDLNLGDDITNFMEDGLSRSDRVLIICTENYVRKADAGKGGVAYERMIVTAELIRNLGTQKFIPIIKQESQIPKLPKFLGARLYIDLSEEASFDRQFIALLRELHNQPELKKPPIGKSPFVSDQYLKIDIDNDNKRELKEPINIGNNVSYESKTTSLDVKEILKTILASIVEFPGEIQITLEESGNITVFKIKVHRDDISKLIGKQGITRGAIRSILEDVGRRDKRQYMIEISS